MTNRPVEGISIESEGDRVYVEVAGARWEGDAAEAERLLTRLHYVLHRARPDTHIASMFLNGTLWGGKFVESDRDAAVRQMREVIAQLSKRVDLLDGRSEPSPRE